MDINRIRMRHLRCFLMVARFGSVSRAAEAMGTVQPSVSRSIRELETELGTTLFDRSGVGVTLNDTGVTLFNHVLNGLGQVDRGLDAVHGPLSRSRVTAYVLPTVVRTVMPGAVNRFKAAEPGVCLTFLQPSGTELHDSLRAGEADFGFGRMLDPEYMQGLSFEHLFSEPLVFFVRAGHPLAGQRHLTVRDLDRHTVVLPLAGTIIRAEMDRFLISQGLESFSDVIESISFEFARSFMAISDAVVLQPLGAMHKEAMAGTAVRLDVADGAMVGSVGLTTPACQQVTGAAHLLMEKVREEVADLKKPGGYIAAMC